MQAFDLECWASHDRRGANQCLGGTIAATAPAKTAGRFRCRLISVPAMMQAWRRGVRGSRQATRAELPLAFWASMGFKPD